MYAIVRCGGRQEKVSVDDVLNVDKLSGDVGSSVTLPAVLVVDDNNVISDPAEVSGYEITAEIVGDAAGPKINMIHYRNKTGYRRRLGHRQKYTQLRVTGIGAPNKAEQHCEGEELRWHTRRAPHPAGTAATPMLSGLASSVSAASA